MNEKKTLFGLMFITVVAVVVGCVIGCAASNNTADAADALKRATRAPPDRDAYFPNTEDLAPDEMRIIACGTGMPSARESQAASCFLVELGNGDKFIFDGGTGSDARIGALEIPYDLLDKIFISHLHTDHWGSFPAY
jgi:ribonuclease Z